MDTKFEFVLDPEGRITLVEFSARYIALYERVTGRTFIAPPVGEPVKARIRRNLARYF